MEIWKTSVDLATDIYRITNKGKFLKDYGLRDQIRRAVISISSNIAEGFEMNNNNDFIKFLRISKGSLGEVKSQLFVSFELGYINQEEHDSISDKLSLLGPKIGKFISYLQMKRNNKEFATR